MKKMLILIICLFTIVPIFAQNKVNKNSNFEITTGLNYSASFSEDEGDYYYQRSDLLGVDLGGNLFFNDANFFLKGYLNYNKIINNVMGGEVYNDGNKKLKFLKNHLGLGYKFDFDENNSFSLSLGFIDLISFFKSDSEIRINHYLGGSLGFEYVRLFNDSFNIRLGINETLFNYLDKGTLIELEPFYLRQFETKILIGYIV